MKYKKQIQLIAAIVTLIVFPVITFYLMEAYTHNPFEEVRPWAQFFNILLFELLAWIFVSVTGKIQSGLRIELVIAMIYGIANAYVVRFRTNPIVPWDIFSWKTAASVASNYDFKPDTRMVVVTLVFLGMIVLLQFVKTGIPKFQLWKRLIPAGVCCIVLVLFVNLLQDEDFQTGHRLYPFLFTPAFMTQVNGMAVTFAMDLAYVTVEKPSGYDAAKEQAALLEEKSVTLSIKAGEGGKAFGSVSSKEIAAAYKEQCNMEIDKKKIQLPESIKTFGMHEVPVKLHPQVTGKLHVKVVEA